MCVYVYIYIYIYICVYIYRVFFASGRSAAAWQIILLIMIINIMIV